MDSQELLEQLFETFGQLHKLLDSHAHESREERAATAMQFTALMFLKSNDDVSIGEIAAHLKLSKSSATQLVDRLVKAGLVRRADDTADRRVVHVAITEEGVKQLTAMKRQYMDKMRALLSKVPERDLRELLRIHQGLIKTVQKEQQQKYESDNPTKRT